MNIQDRTTILQPGPLTSFHRVILSNFRKHIGTSPRLLEFLVIFEELRLDAFAGDPGRAEAELAEDFGNSPEIFQSQDASENDLIRNFRVVMSNLKRNVARNDLFTLVQKHEQGLLMLLRRAYSPGAQPTAALWFQIGNAYAEILQAVLADKAVFTDLKVMSGPGVRWPKVVPASREKATVEKIKFDDPSLYERLLKSEEQVNQINANIADQIRKDGLEPSKVTIIKRQVMIGTDKVTGEILVYDLDGSRTPLNEYKEKIREENRKIKVQVNATFENLNQFLPKPELPIMQKLTEIGKTSPESIRYVSLSDDPYDKNKLTRIYPIVEINGVNFVQDGRFKGMRYDEVVNSLGRMIEGSVFYYDPQSDRPVRVSIRKKNGDPDVKRTIEPYVTTTKHKGVMKLFLKCPSDTAFTAFRNKVRDLVYSFGEDNPKSPIVYKPESRNSEFYFEPRVYELIKKQVGGLAMSSSAVKLLRDYYNSLLRAQQAAQSEDLSRFDELGLERRDREGNVVPSLWKVQKKALAWLEANGDRGVCALDTGMGKTSVAIAAIQSLIERGVDREGNGRFLFVCEKSLLGNFANEVREAFPPDSPDAANIIAKTDVMMYKEFRKKRREDPTFGDDYTAIYFDEAHLHFIKRSSADFRAASGLKCSRIVMLSASPMITTPQDMYSMSSLCNGIDLKNRAARREENLFLKRFATRVGGRITGITKNRELEEEMMTWVKKNVFYADKVDARQETNLPELRVNPPIAVTMSPEVEVVYRDTMKELTKKLFEIGNKEAMRQEFAVAVDISKNSRDVSKLLARLTMLSDSPEEVVPGAPNPKMQQVLNILRENTSGRTIMFGDSVSLVQKAFDQAVKQFPLKSHAAAFADSIIVVDALGNQTKYTKKVYFNKGKPVSIDEWSTHILKNVVSADPNVMTLALTGGYAVGQNLQAFNNVVHLDRDTWSNETMRQRTARAWRSGQRQDVSEFVIDTVYQNPVAGPMDNRTLDELRRAIQQIDADLFHRIVRGSKDFILGESWSKTENMLSMEVGSKSVEDMMLQRALSPYAYQGG